MTTNNYSVKRDKIFAGKVIGEFEFEQIGHDLKSKKLYSCTYYPYRSMLYRINSDGYADDLLYDSPNYRVFNGKNLAECLNEEIIIVDSCNLGPILKYYGYGEDIDYSKVEEIRKTLFNGVFPHLHCDNFGLIEVDPTLQRYYDNRGKIVTDPTILAKLIRERRKNARLTGNRVYTQACHLAEMEPEILEKIILPEQYFEMLIKLGDKSFLEVLHKYEEKMNAFKPHKDEGPIRSLKKSTF